MLLLHDKSRSEKSSSDGDLGAVSASKSSGSRVGSDLSIASRALSRKGLKAISKVLGKGVCRLHMLIKHDMNPSFTFLDSPNNCMLSTSAVFRRQQFLLRSLGGYSNQIHTKIIQEAKAMSGTTLEADAENILRKITPTLDRSRHKGQAGKVAVIGGCREYTGAPYFAAISALKIGADLSHVFCTKDAAPVIKSYSPELIVHPVFEESYSVRDEDKGSISGKVLSEFDKWMERFDCLVVGPGLGRDPFLLDCVSEIMKHARRSNVPFVIDGHGVKTFLADTGLSQDGLFLVTNNLDLVSGYPLAVLTPNVNEYKRLVQKVMDSEVNDQDAPKQLLSLARRIGGTTILRKGKTDLVSDGETVLYVVNSVSIFGSPRRCGGQGDILSGSVAVFLSWARQHILAAEGDISISPSNPMVLGCIAGSTLMRKAASLAFENKKRATLTGDIIECLGRSLEDICPAS
ncbi:hypothetical protein HHK36_026680 [Tetracentron sinense]|uniref:ATP-dependent (S)-NAD(P)H-hydrate dehydratase n=1 Tax=Tetracentron sinense TaxID=13715 RepID=A0A834YGF0_TETSI|nr:hypothetical protein HHK36_026680 [Tetracentron sinense]